MALSLTSCLLKWWMASWRSGYKSYWAPATNNLNMTQQHHD